MAENAKEVTGRDIMEKMEALASGPLSDNQRAQVTQLIEDTVDDRVAAKLEAAKIKPEPEPGNELAGTRYARMGLNALDLQVAHGILQHGREIGWSKRGPSEELRNIVEAIQTRVIADERIDMRAMDTADTTALIGAQYVATMWESAMQAAVVAPLIRSFPMSDKTAYIPVFGAPPTPVIYSESTQDDSADYEVQDTAFARVTVTATKFGIHQKWSGELEEESIIPFASAIRAQQTGSMGYFTDDIVMNGDTTIAATGNINSDDAQLASNNRYVGFDGLRHGAIVDNTALVINAGAALTYSHLLQARGLCLDYTRLHNWGYPANAADFIYVTGPGAVETVMNLDEIVTIDKFGPQASVLNSQIGRVGANPFLTTMAVPRTEADGKVSTTAGNNTLEQIVAFNRNAYSIGYLRQVTVETYRRPERDQNGIILFWRMGLARYSPTGAASGITHVAVIRNI